MTENDTRPLLLVVAAALIDADNRVLIQQRPLTKAYAGKWEFPGGKVDPGETPPQALVRELKEELNVTTVEKALFPLTFMAGGYESFGFNVVTLIYGCRNWTGLPQALEDQPQLAWVKPPRLGDYDLLEKNREALPVLCELI